MNAVDRVNKATLHYLFHYKSQGPSDDAFRSQAGNKPMAVMQVLVNLRHSLQKHVVHAKDLQELKKQLANYLEEKSIEGYWQMTWGSEDALS